MSAHVVARIVLILIAAVVLAGCGGGSTASESELTRTTVVAAFYPLAHAAELVGGETVAVENLTPPGAEPHDVELSVRDVERVRSAELVLYLGGGFQPALEDAVAGARGRVVDLRPDESRKDPHVWLDPVRYARIVERVGKELRREERARGVAGELRALDREFRAGLRHCRRRELVTGHAAFGYLAERYRLQPIAVSGLSPEAEPTARALEAVVREVRRAGATTVYAEALLSPRLVTTVAREAGARTDVLNPLEGLSEQEVERGATYLSVMRANLTALRRGLGCR